MKCHNRFIYTLAILIIALSQTTSSRAATQPISSFRFHLMGETYTLDPMEVSGSSGSYLFHNLYRGLFRYHRNKGLIPEGAKRCSWKEQLTLVCELQNKNWSNGEPITAKHYVTAFQRLVSAQAKSSTQQLLIELKNARRILAGKVSTKALGVSAKTTEGRSYVTFAFEQKDPDFLYKLALPQLAPIFSAHFPTRENAANLVVNGPYKIASWKKGHSVQLVPNKHYDKSFSSRPLVEVFFIDDDDTALRLYEAGKLNFLRRVPAHFIDSFKTRKDFYQFSMARFDYIGFGEDIKKSPALRKALALSLDYQELKKILHALGAPGCPSIPREYFTKVPCHKMDLKRARAFLVEAQQKNQIPLKITFQYSKMGGEDIRRQVEWFQHQWKKHLGLSIEIEGVEQGMLTQTLLSHPKQMFRKGQSLDRPTCLAALETLQKNHPENYLKLDDSSFEKIVKLTTANSFKKKSTRKLCTEAIQILIKTAAFIPMGEIHFSLLVKDSFHGWHLNELNQLDLTDLIVSK